MALPTQNLFIPLGAGVRRDIDPHVFPVGKSGLVFNGIYDQLGQIVKRPGTFGLSTARAGAGLIGTTWQLATFRGSLVNLAQGPGTDPIDVYSPTIAKWATVSTQSVVQTSELSSGRMGPVGVSLIPIAGDTTTSIPGDIAIAAGFVFMVHTNSSNATTFYAIDAATNRTVYRWVIVGSASQPRVISLNGYVAVVYFDTVNSIKAAVWQISALSGAPTIYPIVNDALGIFDTIQTSSTVFTVAYRQNTNNLYRSDVTIASGLVVTTLVTTAAAGAINPSLAISWINDLGSSGKLAVATAGPAGVQVQWDLTGGTPASTRVLDAAATANVAHICGHTISSNATGEFQVLYEIANGILPSVINIGQRTVAGGIASGVWLNSVGLTSKTFNVTQPSVLVNYNFFQTKQPTYFLMPVRPDALTNNTFSTPQARLGIWSAVSASASSNLPNVGSLGSLFMTPVAISQVGTGSPVSVSIATVQNNPTLGKTAEAAGGLLIPGGTSTFFDGITLGSNDFDVYPEQPGVTAVAGAGLSVGTYFYQVVYVRYDANGRIIRSAPSIPSSVNIPGAGTSAANLSIFNLQFTNVPVKIEIYRGVVNVTSPLQLIATIDNNPATLNTTYHDTIADTIAAAGIPIYTTGGVLEHDPTPGFSSLLVAQNRAFGISMDDPTEIWVSNEFTDTDAISFNEAFIIKIADENGPLTGLGAIDDKIIPIKAAAVYAFNGDGPDPLGRGGFSVPQIIARGLGTSNPQSILPFPDGLAFASTATTRGGIQLIDRSLNVRIAEDGSTFGSPVKADTDSFAVAASCVVPQLSQARWYLTNGIVCVYDYVRGSWTEFFYAEGSSAVTSAVAYNGTAVRSNTGAVPIMADAADLTFPCTDNGVPFFFTIETPWIQLAGVQGFERLMKIQGSGATTGTHVLTVQVFADFDRTAAVGSYSGTPGALWDWELVPRSQRNRAFLIRIADNNSGTAGPSVAGITMRLGLYQGLAQKSSGRRLRA